MGSDFDLAFTEFLNAVQQGFSAEPTAIRGILVVSGGSKKIKVMKKGSGALFTVCFVEKSTGDILKAASYKAAAKGARGNIYKPNTYESARTDPYGGWLYARH